jgi:hypothetical protein
MDRGCLLHQKLRIKLLTRHVGVWKWRYTTTWGNTLHLRRQWKVARIRQIAGSTKNTHTGQKSGIPFRYPFPPVLSPYSRARAASHFHGGSTCHSCLDPYISERDASLAITPVKRREVVCAPEKKIGGQTKTGSLFCSKDSESSDIYIISRVWIFAPDVHYNKSQPRKKGLGRARCNASCL